MPLSVSKPPFLRHIHVPFISESYVYNSSLLWAICSHLTPSLDICIGQHVIYEAAIVALSPGPGQTEIKSTDFVETFTSLCL
jgi:hypothetical protein